MNSIINREIETIFPTTIVKYSLANLFTDQEKQYCLSKKDTARVNNMNLVSEDSNILEHVELTKLREYLLHILEDYKNNIMLISDDIKFYITQSWLNFNEPGMSHHIHNHSNSVVSAVVYLTDKSIITFHNPLQKIFEFNYNTYTPLNSGAWNYGVNYGDVIVFPSNLLHSVPVNMTMDTRVTLACNTFITGELGNREYSNYLKI